MRQKESTYVPGTTTYHPMEAIPSLKLLEDYLVIFPQIKKTRAVRDLTDMLRQEARNSRIGIRLMHSLVHKYFMKGS